MASSPEDFRRLEKCISVEKYIMRDIFVTTTRPKDLLAAYPDAYYALDIGFRNTRLITFYVQDDILYGRHYLGRECWWDKRIGFWSPI